MSHRQRGFSLMEVLVALVILSIVMLSVATLCNHSIRFSSYAQQRILARWVAQNALSQTQLGLVSLPIHQGSVTKDVLMGNQPWHWQLQTKPSSYPGLLHTTITVTTTNNSAFKYTYYGYTGAPHS